MRIFLILMFLLFPPLQAAQMLAEPLRAHDTEQQVHVLSVHCDQQVQKSSHSDDTLYTQVGDCCHHHCHAPSLGMLSTAPLVHTPVFSLKTPNTDHCQFQSFLHSRIERPKWA